MNDLPRTNTERIRAHDGVPVRVVTGARLHFGLLDTAAPFGGVGVMIDQPATEITLSPHSHFQPDPSIATRANEIAARLCMQIGRVDLPECRIELVRRPPTHSGLGSGTQSSLAIAEGLCRLMQIELDPTTLAVEIAGRGKRSAVGVHGYFHGGLIHEQSDKPVDLNPIRKRIELPDTWRVLIVKPRESIETISGESEVEQFASLETADSKSRTHLTNLLLEQILPAAESSNFEHFANAVSEYNRASGMLFASVQGGAYHSKPVTHLIDQLIHLGGQGVGQSSWGPGVFVWFESEANACEFLAKLPANSELISHARPGNRGRTLSFSNAD